MDKHAFAKRLVKFCVFVLSSVLVWAVVIKTISTITGNSIDISDVLTYTGAAFGGELLLLLLKRVFADKDDKEE